MKKKIILIIFWVLLLFIISNYNIFLWNFYFLKANKNYEKQIFTLALEYYDKSLNYLSWSRLYYNAWNSFYRLWEEEKNKENQIEYYKNSLESYNLALDYDINNNREEDIDTRFNYEFVKKKLEKLTKNKG